MTPPFLGRLARRGREGDPWSAVTVRPPGGFGGFGRGLRGRRLRTGKPRRLGSVWPAGSARIGSRSGPRNAA
eukprot:3287025-Lingulodinium_polyedra.AAC.1